MSTVFEGVYKQTGQADIVLPVKVDSTGRLETTATAVVSSEVEIKNDSGNPVPISGTVTANTGLTQPLTDTQLRASALPVAGTAAAGFAPTAPPLSVSGIDDAGLKRHLLTDAAGRQIVVVNSLPEVEVKNDSGNPLAVSGTVTANTGLAQPLTDTQLRATAVAVSGSAAVGVAPSLPPLSVSGVDAGGLKRHFLTDAAGNQGIYGAAIRSTSTATIANAASVSGSIDLTSTALLGFIAPAAWTTAALNLEVSMDNTNWATVIYDSGNSPVGSWSAVVAGAAYAVDTVSMLPFRYVRLRSGTSASPVTQGAQRDFTVITRPLA